MFYRIFLIAVICTAPGFSAQAYERGTGIKKLLSDSPEKVIRLEKKGRMPASVDSEAERKKAEAEELDTKLKVGTYAIVQKTIDEWNDEVVQIVSRFEDGRRKIRRPDGSYLFVERDNLRTLSPETDACCDSNGTQICNGDTVYHPLVTASLGVPEGKVLHTFENCTMVIRDGLEYIYNAAQLGKQAICSPQKETVCIGKVVFAQGYRNGNRYTFEGPVTQVYTDGTVLVSNGEGLMPVNASSLQVQTESLPGTPNGKGGRGLASVNDSSEPLEILPALEPFDVDDALENRNHQGISIPAHR